MTTVNGKVRVIIENIQPQVDGGLYPAKRTIGEHVDVTADIFGDGHDHIRAQVLYKKKDAAAWKIIEMKPSFNDAWLASFPVTEKGLYVFTVRAWIDHFDTWYDGFRKKAAAKVDVRVELMEGVQVLKDLAVTYSNRALVNAAKRLEEDYEKAVAHVLTDDFAQLVHDHPLIQHEALAEKELVVRVEH